jgi:hypothetical protein
MNLATKVDDNMNDSNLLEGEVMKNNNNNNNVGETNGRTMNTMEH